MADILRIPVLDEDFDYTFLTKDPYNLAIGSARKNGNILELTVTNNPLKTTKDLVIADINLKIFSSSWS